MFTLISNLQITGYRSKPDRQLVYNVTMKCVRLPIVTVEKQQLLHILRERERERERVALHIHHAMLMRHCLLWPARH